MTACLTEIIRPEWSEHLTRLRLKRGTAKYTILGLEKQCKRCGDFWCADNEFWAIDKTTADGLSNWCIACYRDYRKEWTKKSPKL